ncbi:MAG: nucleotide sugar dehydrogenase, partial [Caldisericia bacterium]|nr:nucleotide sugar dehydrogenase [Caldisericia bacterium]
AFLKKYFNGDYHIVNEVEVAEASKIVENLQRDLNIAMVNTLSLFLIKNNLIPSKVIECAKTHKRVKNLLSPGLGVGGHCLPYAYYYLKESIKIKEKDLKLFELGRKINDNMPKEILNLILKRLKKKGKDPKNLKISILGLAMKDFSKDTRESPSIKFIKYAKNYFKEVLAYDPDVNIDLEEKRESLEEVLKNSDVLLIPILQNSYRDLTVQYIKSFMNEKPLIVDIKKLFKENDLKSFGFEYIIF